LLALALIVAGCAGPAIRTPTHPTPPVPPPAPIPADIESIPDPVPRSEPRSARGNPAFYDVLGKRYFVLASADPPPGTAPGTRRPAPRTANATTCMQ
jgi:rare lipoprotein A